jgi:hypothetical protein
MLESAWLRHRNQSEAGRQINRSFGAGGRLNAGRFRKALDRWEVASRAVPHYPCASSSIYGLEGAWIVRFDLLGLKTAGGYEAFSFTAPHRIFSVLWCCCNDFQRQKVSSPRSNRLNFSINSGTPITKRPTAHAAPIQNTHLTSNPNMSMSKTAMRQQNTPTQNNALNQNSRFFIKDHTPERWHSL